MIEYVVWGFVVGMLSYLAARIVDAMWVNYRASL